MRLYEREAAELRAERAEAQARGLMDGVKHWHGRAELAEEALGRIREMAEQSRSREWVYAASILQIIDYYEEGKP